MISILFKINKRNIPQNYIFGDMQLNDIWQDIISYAQEISVWELSGLVFGILAVLFLIKESIWTWPAGIAYVIVSFFVFWEARLYGDFILHIFFLVLNIYGWYYWVKGKGDKEPDVVITHTNSKRSIIFLLLTIVGIFTFGQFLINIPSIFEGVEPAALPYWDSTTSILSVTGMWLTARKKIDNWYYWFAVDVIATGVYFYKELYFYSFLYFLYIGMAIAGYMAWKKTMMNQPQKQHD
ncbi:nicotinamide riboside transporter PnuC [Roseivirga sp.]|uniref:nicotinamide riboside transporter PnuC n=1 Tax=Roseivirga sp. TaxID=1964215 RepID=UPI002B26A46B|nr:nicotinamide riboside transporter PnuC [Roseivirga sp.]